MRLTDDLAARRQFYHRSIATMPDLVLIDIPASYLGTDLLLGRFYPIIVETDAEQAELERFLARPRPTAVVPDLLDRRPSMLRSDQVVFSPYAPPAEGWPWMLLCYWPRDYAELEPAAAAMFARGHYTTEAFDNAEALAAGMTALVEALGSHLPIHVRSLDPTAFVGSA